MGNVELKQTPESGGSTLNDGLGDLICPWCDTHKLRIVYGEERTSNGNSSVFFSGYYVVCSNPGEFNCADTTGMFETKSEAVKAAKEYCRAGA